MSRTSKVLVKNPILNPAQDFYSLRRDGIGFIAQMGSKQWTDYNVHDPGITILEALCYAITDIAYRSDWRIEDILTPASGQPISKQTFFTAREILVVNPVNPDDLRLLLIDLKGVRNAWLLCKECPCEASYLAYCKNEALVLSYAPPTDDGSIEAVTVTPQGLYEVLLELEADAVAGDLNDRKVEIRTELLDQTGVLTTIMELRFPDIALTHWESWRIFLAADLSISDNFVISSVRIGAEKGYDVFTEFPGDLDKQNEYIRKNWRSIFYVSFEIDLTNDADEVTRVTFEDAALRLIGDIAAKNSTTAKGLADTLRAGDVIKKFQEKAKLAQTAVQGANRELLKHRNLDEDYCLINTVGIEEVAVCANIEVSPDADIEDVQGRIWFALENHFNPPLPFQTLEQLMEAGEAVEDIFNGPELEAVFIQKSDLQNSALKSTLRVSDIVNILMDIPGIRAVNQLLLTKYDAEGNPAGGASDPTWVNDAPVFDPNRVSASWILFISSRHVPRLYINMSRFLFYKNGLPFSPRMDEATDVLNQLRGDALKAKSYDSKNDLVIPKGNYLSPEDYYPIQYGFPAAYGIGPEGLPTSANAARQAKARQLKAYLMIFEQILGNELAQLAHTADLFSLDPQIEHTYFTRTFDNNLISGFDDIRNSGLTYDAVTILRETRPEFLRRRNRFLDHLLARFGEDFSQYTLLATDASGKRMAEQQLIRSKIALLNALPAISRDRARAFDYRFTPNSQGNTATSATPFPCSADNNACIKRRVSLLMGFPDLALSWEVPAENAGSYTTKYSLNDGGGDSLFEGQIIVSAASESEANTAAYQILIRRLAGTDVSAYEIAPESDKFCLSLYDSSLTEIGAHTFDTRAAALRRQKQLMAWSTNERMIVVEHLLLRPKFPGDALYPACSEGPCKTCGDEDPYSFRLTFVMPGWASQYVNNLDLRRHAERTIQQETPSHLLPKICWVGNDGLIEDPCADVIAQIAHLLLARGSTSAGESLTSSDVACECAKSIYHAFVLAFSNWHEDNMLDSWHKDALANVISTALGSVNPADVACAAEFSAELWSEVQSIVAAHFTDIALNGWQFERFERAWYEWLQANAAMDWTEERLQERVEALIKLNLTTSLPQSEVCKCAKSLLANYGSTFYDWMHANLSAGNSFENLTEFVGPSLSLCPQITLKPGAIEAIAKLLAERYGAYKEVSYRLWKVVNLLSQLRSIYPGATLHDCDDGSDHNPVRLDYTALGNYPNRFRPI